MTHVIDFDLPGASAHEFEKLTHVIGRTGRGGRTGRAICLYDASEDIKKAPFLLELVAKKGSHVEPWLHADARLASRLALKNKITQARKALYSAQAAFEEAAPILKVEADAAITAAEKKVKDAQEALMRFVRKGEGAVGPEEGAAGKSSSPHSVTAGFEGEWHQQARHA